MSKEKSGPGSYPPEDDNSPEDDSVDSVAEAKTAEALPSYLEELEAEFGQRLATLLYARLNAMSEAELDFIREDEELRNKAAYRQLAHGQPVVWYL